MKAEEQKKRTRRLIELVGLVSISGLDSLDKGELLGLLIQSHSAYERLSIQAKQALKITGWCILRQRKKERQKLKQS